MKTPESRRGHGDCRVSACCQDSPASRGALTSKRLHNYGDGAMVDETHVGISGNLTVAQAAQLLSVSANQVRQLIATGELEAVKAGPVWMIPHRTVESRQGIGWGAGRRLAPANAWALLFLADGDEVPWLDR